MEIYQLKTFLVVAREQHLTRAAERLHVSQPAVSGQIKSLEVELGITLFERKHGGMELTKAGSEVLQHVQKVLGAAADLMAHASRLSGKVSGKLSLGIILDPETIRLGELTNYLLRHRALLDVDIRHRNSFTVVSNLRSGELDASFFIGRDIADDVRGISLRKIQYRVVASPSWSGKLKDADWPDVAALPWISTPREGAIFQMADTLFRQAGLQLRTVIEADQESAIVSLVQSGLGLSLMREELALDAAARRQLILWEKGRTESTLKLIYLAVRETEPLLQTLRTAVAEVWDIPEGLSAASEGATGARPVKRAHQRDV